jgi:hypothetical protein
MRRTVTVNTNIISKDNTDAPKATQATPNARPLSPAQFCEAEGFSLSTYYKLKREGNGPEEELLPGTSIIRITPKAYRDWRIKMEKWNKTKEAKIEKQRRLELARAAGEASVVSRKAGSRKKAAKRSAKVKP